MNIDIGSIGSMINSVSGFFQSALGGIFGGLGLSSETGNGLLNFVKFFEVSGGLFLALFQKIASIFSGLAG